MKIQENHNQFTLEQALTSCQTRHFMRTFGYLHLPTFLKPPQVIALQDDFVRQYEEFYSLPWKEMATSGVSRIKPALADNSDTASAILTSKECEKLCSYILGDDFIFLGSEGSLFFTGSPWHRDLFTLAPLLKINIYLDANENGQGGQFLVIPGSQFPGSVYADLLNNALAWPDKPAKLGGMAESGFLPMSKDPRSPSSNGNTIDLPCVQIRITPGDFILFDLRAVHSVSTPIPSVMRRLITFIFAENPLSMPDDHYALVSVPHKTRQELYDEIIDVKALSALRNGFSGYGSRLLSHVDYIKKHGLDFTYVEERTAKMAAANGSLKKEGGTHHEVNMRAMAGFLNQNKRAVRA